jgi:predicted RNA binding protein YcfA (HicA-like mRNA interferase family)
MPLSGKQMLKKFQQDGWKILWQTGSHVRVGKGKFKESIPMHKELKKGTEHALLKKLEEAHNAYLGGLFPVRFCLTIRLKKKVKGWSYEISF